MSAGRPFSVGPWLLGMILMLGVSLAKAQSPIDQVHIMSSPAVQLGSLLSPRTAGIIRANVELVVVPVTVLDASDRIITGLGQENFQLYEDKRLQSIRHFWKEDSPVSVGVVLDVSGSMDVKIEPARDAVMALLRASNPQDEFFLITFADRPTLVQDFTPNVDAIAAELPFEKPKGRTCLIDAMVLALHNMRTAQYQRKALVIISDGGDNQSRYTEKELKSLLKESDVLVYSIGIFDREFPTYEEQIGPELLAGISGQTGGGAYVLDNPEYLPSIAGHVATELRNQYMLAYHSDSSRRDGKWRKIRVKLALPRGLSHLYAQARKGYYGPLE